MRLPRLGRLYVPLLCGSRLLSWAVCASVYVTY